MHESWPLDEYEVEVLMVGDQDNYNLAGAVAVQLVDGASLVIVYPDINGNIYTGWHRIISGSSWREVRHRKRMPR